jgi:bisphosphoglycerate-dependent phosphoglycerate mutase
MHGRLIKGSTISAACSMASRLVQGNKGKRTSPLILTEVCKSLQKSALQTLCERISSTQRNLSVRQMFMEYGVQRTEYWLRSCGELLARLEVDKQSKPRQAQIRVAPAAKKMSGPRLN